uniref:AWS domain-containing protein n=1 Tax=Globodera pallida TaxID=36090 RepID=A0A183BJE9_GLOPA
MRRIGKNHECIQSLRYRDGYLIYGIVEHILRHDWNWTITEDNANKWLASIPCHIDVSCETYRCKDEEGNDNFVINACAREKIKDAKSTKCTNNLKDGLGAYCTNPDYPVCSQCYGAKCNENRINLELPKSKTKKPPERNAKTNKLGPGPASTTNKKVRGTTTKPPPTANKTSALRCLLEAICKASDDTDPSKLSRRFALRKPKKSKKHPICMDRTKLDERMKNVKDPKFNQYEGLSIELKGSKKKKEMKMMFLDEYLLAIVD